MTNPLLNEKKDKPIRIMLIDHVNLFFVYKLKFHLIWFFQLKTVKVMAGAPDPDLFDFIGSLEREEKYSTTTAAAPNNII